jgi:hypothetical protein
MNRRLTPDDFTIAECGVVVRWLRGTSLIGVVRNWLKARINWGGSVNV